MACGASLILQIEDLEFTYGRTKILDGLSLNVSEGTIWGLVGASGSGKTTLIRLITGILKPNKGLLNVFGKPPSSDLLSWLGYMPQAQALYADLSVQQNIDFFARMFGLANTSRRAETVKTIIEEVSLWEKRKHSVANLSGGERQRVNLAIALVHNPPLVLLDEPTVGLDPQLRGDLWKYFRNLAANGTTLIISSHVMDDARRCDQVGFLQGGRILASGTPLDLIAQAGNPSSHLEDAFLYFMNKRDRQ
ncbi:MAG: ABC transporter ATP-binding protein [SAR202 cluster bacterium Io17-Chloro-G3]|nr:MAG: ABC transporter ATP-binding protein [SAR202 cluster bacterium Io17-Chloro-G3]